jgi:hypothetical protein
VKVDARGTSAVSQAGGVLLVETIRAAGSMRGLCTGLAPWRQPGAVHDPAKVQSADGPHEHDKHREPSNSDERHRRCS